MTIRLNHLDVARTYAEGGVTLKEMGEMFGCSNMTIQRSLKRLGVPRKAGGYRAVPQDPKTGRFMRALPSGQGGGA